ncbi:ferric reductase [Lophiotrema nucula]|uniref:Ferric reductase n=1 Tax=Lophiotrema nucula TaxID=690887 RepID=A0A6A5ZPY9_9PLEO|nr:ferric reductase [Lophiotrema nucula]
MSAYLHSRRVDPVASSTEHRTLQPRAGILDSWLPGHNLNYTHGLTGVDQTGNYRWSEALAICFLILSLGTLALRIWGMGLRHWRHLAGMQAPHQQTFWAINHTTWWPWMNRHLFAAPLWKKKHNKGFQLSSAIDNGTLPGRWNFILLFVYGMSNLAYCLCLPYHEKGVAAALRGRTGTLAALNLVPTVLFALRNNPLIYILQVSYDDFNLFHRWAARITIIEAIVHTGSWAGTVLKDGTIKDLENALRVEASYTWGMVATVCFTFIFLQAWSPIRHAFYETFLNIHRLVVVFSIVGLWYHLEKHGLPQLPWLKIIIAMWSLEWAWRVGRILYFARPFKLNTSYSPKIKVEAMPGEACRVTVDLARPWQPTPGCHAHIYMPALALWSSHPFSIAWAHETQPFSKEATLPTLEGEVLAPSAPAKSKQISFICRARNGFTRKMYERASQAEDLSFTTPGFIEGPYGGNHSLDSYGTAVLFAGGVGITHQVMYLKRLIQGAHDGTTCTRRILLVWTIPESDCLEWVRPWMDQVLRLPGRKNILRIMLFISRPKRKLEHLSDSVKMIPGRPNIASLIDEEIRHRQGAMAVTVCASGGFADDVRAAVRPRLEDGAIDFIEEAFTY